MHHVVKGTLLLLAQLLLADLKQALHLFLLLLVLDLDSDGSEEGFQMCEEILVGDLQIPVEEEEKLPFHQVDLRHGEAKASITPDAAMSCPMLVLWT